MNKLKLEFNLRDNLDKIKKSDSYFHTFINKDSLATGILILKPGEEDTQEPHESDEVYFIISGNGFLKIKNKDCESIPKVVNIPFNRDLFLLSLNNLIIKINEIELKIEAYIGCCPIYGTSTINVLALFANQLL